MLKKIEKEAFSIFLSPYNHSPSSLWIVQINNFLLFPLIHEWKFFELLSPLLNHLI